MGPDHGTVPETDVPLPGGSAGIETTPPEGSAEIDETPEGGGTSDEGCATGEAGVGPVRVILSNLLMRSCQVSTVFASSGL